MRLAKIHVFAYPGGLDDSAYAVQCLTELSQLLTANYSIPLFYKTINGNKHQKSFAGFTYGMFDACNSIPGILTVSEIVGILHLIWYGNDAYIKNPHKALEPFVDEARKRHRAWRYLAKKQVYFLPSSNFLSDASNDGDALDQVVAIVINK